MSFIDRPREELIAPMKDFPPELEDAKLWEDFAHLQKLSRQEPWPNVGRNYIEELAGAETRVVAGETGKWAAVNHLHFTSDIVWPPAEDEHVWKYDGAKWTNGYVKLV